LGDGTYGGRPGFAAVVGGLTFATLSARGSTTCGVTSGRAAYCWGAVPGQLEGVTSPALVTGGLSFATISTGFQICGVATGGAARRSEDGHRRRCVLERQAVRDHGRGDRRRRGKIRRSQDRPAGPELHPRGQELALAPRAERRGP